MMGEELRTAREKAGLTQEQLSFQAGLSRPYLCQLERNLESLERNLESPTVDRLFRICDAPEVSAADLVRRVDAARKRAQSGRWLCWSWPPNPAANTSPPPRRKPVNLAPHPTNRL
jgi:transcriptional regulator with XRE-family HTH domain